ncbi:MAG: hypothetical protein QOG62_2544 [Thermoleophilaceae bacterium]|jgi:NAD(P)H-dependent flavin oxidoreductase YrpB (nitropropane dioxygenase family)|nr:hypothetical protein [Thermoleophilaceae bacterium]
MGGGIAPHGLAAAVSEAGGLGQVGHAIDGNAFAREIEAARRLTGKPLAVNVIVPLARPGHWKAAQDADIVVTHWEARPKRRGAKPWIHTCGNPEEARAAVAAGADGVIAQGVESGGHVRGTVPALELLEQIQAVVPAGYPVLLAGGIADAGDVQRALDAGASAAIAGTRFVASEESGAHPGYRQRILDGSDTILTELFGMGWPKAPHRVLRNAATERWLGPGDATPRLLRQTHAALSALSPLMPLRVQAGLMARTATGPLDLSPQMPVAGMDPLALDTKPLYAGQTVARIKQVLPAADIVALLTP